MTRYIFKPTAFHKVIGHRSPALTISDGDTVFTETLEAWGFAADGRRLAGPSNPRTGLFFVGDADLGDALEISIDRITPNRAMAGPLRPSR
jgi:amidase